MQRMFVLMDLSIRRAGLDLRVGTFELRWVDLFYMILMRKLVKETNSL
jgi:hypothetical protein